MGLFLGIFLALNQFFLYYTNLIAPYCLIFLIQTLTISSLIDYFKKPSRFNFKKLNIYNCLLILCDSLGFLYVISELIVIYLLGKRKRVYKFQSIKLFHYSFVAFLVVLPILIVQYAISARLVIPNTYNGIGLNLSGLYLMFSDYISPYLSFCAPEMQTKSTIGLLYGFMLNPDLKSINSIKILITLFYSSFLPLIVIGAFTLRAYIKNYKLRLLWLVSIINLGFILLLMLLQKIELHPIYTIQFFITNLILLGYGIFTLKDRFIKILLITCLLLIQVINPDVSSFNITIYKNYASLNPVKIFIEEFNVNNEDLLIMPHQGHFAKKYFKNLNIFDFDNSNLQRASKKSIIKNLCNKKTKTINKRNIHYLTKDYLEEARINEYLAQYFIEKTFEKGNIGRRVILVVDKLNSKPISPNSIYKCTRQKDYSPALRKIDFRYADLSQNQSKALFDALKSKTLYNFINILSTNFRLSSIVEYKKIDNEYYKVESTNNIYKALNSFDSDYLFIIYNGIIE